MTGAVSLHRLLYPSSVAIVGASDRIGPGFNAWRALEHVGYAGEVQLVTPSKPTLFGRATFPSLDAVPGPLDAVFVAVPQEHVLGALRTAAERGAGGAVILSSGFGEAGPAGIAAQREMAAIAEANGMAMCGPNCLGYLNFAGRTALFGTSMPDHVARGGVAAVVQSGSIGIALLNAARGLGLSCLVTSGNEAVTTAGDYLDALVDDPNVTVLIAFLEQLRAPDRFVAAARRARAAGKPLIAVKSGRTERGRRAVLAHTGAVAGADAVCSAALDAAGAIRVGSLDELIEAAVLASSLARKPTAPGVAVLSASGGEIALALDIAEPIGLELPSVPAAREPIAALLPDFAHVDNPLDLTWAGLYDPTVARRCAELLGAQPEIGCLVLLQDAPSGLGDQQATRYSALLRAVAEGAAAVETPLVAVSNLAGALHPAFERAGAELGVPCLRGTAEGLGAVARLARWASTPIDAPAPSVGGGSDALRRLRALPRDRTPNEHEARAVLAAAGIPGPREALAQSADEAVQQAERIGYPVVLKGLTEGVLHKTEAGLVRVGLATSEDVRAAASELLEIGARLAPGRATPILVAEMVTPVAELLIGARVDPDFGPVVVAGGGGVLVELYQDVAVRLAPVSEDAAAAMLRATKAAALLGGWRGRPRGDLPAAARAIAALSRLIADARQDVAEIEVNPLAVLPEGLGAVALDALIVFKEAPV